MVAKIWGLTIFWIVTSWIVNALGGPAAEIVSLIALAVMLTGIGSAVLSAVLGGDAGSHLLAGFMLALPGWLLTEFGFHWHLSSPTSVCAVVHPCAFSAMWVVAGKNVAIVTIGMALVALPVLPLILKLRGQRSSAG